MKNNRICWGVTLLMLLNTSCVDEITERSSGLISPIQDGYQAVDIYDFGMETQIELSAVKSGLQDGNATVSFTVDAAILDSLKNMDSMTYGNCEILPQDCYELNGTFTMQAGEKIATGGTLTLHQHEIAEKSQVGVMKYILPFRITSQGLDTNMERNVLFYGFTVRKAIISSLLESTPVTITNDPISLPVGTNFSPNLWDLKVAFEKTDAKAFVEQYNKENGTSYSPLPAESIKAFSTEAIIAKGNTTGSASITLDKTKIITGEYLYPVFITGITGQGTADISASSDPILLFLSRNDRVDRTGWTATASSFDSYRVPGSILDGNPTTFWLTDWAAHPTPPYDLYIDMKKTIHFNKLGMIPKAGEEATDLRMEVYISDNPMDDSNPGTRIGEELVLKGSIPTEQLFDVGVHDARYIRLHILNSKANNNKDAFMAEFYVHDPNL